MTFDEAVAVWLDKHIKASTGERRKRLKGGLTYGSMLFLRLVWWPMFGNFDNLYPEYEVRDFKDGVRFIDFAYIRLWYCIAIEADGFGPHERDVSKEGFADERDRQTDLVIDGWWIARFSLDRVKEKPRSCQMRMRLLISKGQDEEELLRGLALEEREIVRRAMRCGGYVTPTTAGEWLSASNQYARKLLRQLVDKDILSPDAQTGAQRIHRYRLRSNRNRLL